MSPFQPTALKRQTKDRLIALLSEAQEEQEAQPARYAIILAAGVFIGYALGLG